MAAPEYVPTSVTDTSHYSSPPQRAGGWAATRPGETVGRDFSGTSALGSHGPDQGYALTLTSVFDDKLHLQEGEHRADVDAGCVAVAMKRASFFGRAPVVHDLRIAYRIFGYLEAEPAAELVALRKDLFAEVHYSFHYFERRAIADAVDLDVLALTPDAVASAHRADWRQLIS
ncbi:MAG: hypothetical protein HKN94_08955 [Acidimicrobiales bacterium]|nr:hypothetical protein [Acidimicrobiales bacterium]